MNIIADARRQLWDYSRAYGPLPAWGAIILYELVKARENGTVDRWLKEMRQKAGDGREILDCLSAIANLEDFGSAGGDIWRQSFELLGSLHQAIATIDAVVLASGEHFPSIDEWRRRVW